MTKTIQQNIKSLAISYCAYRSASERGDLNGVIVWGESLIEDQIACGVVLRDEAKLRDHIDYAKSRENKAA